MLVKRFGEEAFEALKGGNFRLGTLAYYRSIEGDERRDAGEGPAPVHFQASEGVPRVIEAEEFNRVSGAIGGLFKLNAPLKGLQINGSGKFIFETALNVFVFCTTDEDGDNPALDAKFGRRKICIPDPNAFSDAVANKLFVEVVHARTVQVNESANSISHGHGAVVYRPKPALRPEDITDTRIDITQVFIKEPGPYAEEKEYRFMWFPEDNRTNKLCFLPPGLKYLDLKFPELWDYIAEA
jgi:hypothetical protein